MATNVVTTNYFRQLVVTKEINLSSDTFKVALMDIYVQSASVSALKQITNWSQVSAHEVSSTGYSALTLTAANISATTSNIICWKGSNLNWPSVTLNTYGYSIYRTSDNMVVGFVEFSTTPVIAVNGAITIQWNTNGIMNIL